MSHFPNGLYETPEDWLQEFLDKIDFEELYTKTVETIRYRALFPDWDRPVVMYGVRRTHHKYIKKQEIAVIIDINPWQDRARTAETHWYNIVYKRPATDLEWEEVKKMELTRRYWICSYYLDKGWTIDKTVSHIVQDDKEEYCIETERIICSFEKYYSRKIRIYRRQTATQLSFL